MNRWNRAGFFILSCCVLVCVAMVFAQIPKLPDVSGEILDKIPGTDEILKSKPPITTSIADAKTEVSFLDDFDSEYLIPMNALPQSSDGAFVLEYPGLYALDVESYCLKAGAYAPTKGDGHLYAPLLGPTAGIVQHIIQKSYAHPEIPQRDIQVLLWAIIARTKISDMSQEKQMTAAKLLTPQELFELNGGALGLVPENERAKAFDKVPEQVRAVLEAEAQLREKLTTGQDNYEELEQVAVRFGVAPKGEGSREIPRGRWSYHPDGYFIRLIPDGYTQTEISLYVPEPFTIERDELNRIILIADHKGNCIETEYDETVAPLVVSGDKNVRGYAFSKVRFIRRLIVPPEVVMDLTFDLENTGWTFVGNASGKGNAGSSVRYAGAQERYNEAYTLKQQIEILDKQLKPKDDMGELLDIGNFIMALEHAVQITRTKKVAWANEHVHFARKAWQYAFSKRQGKYVWGSASPPESEQGWLRNVLNRMEAVIHRVAFADPGSTGKPSFDPGGGLAPPGNTGGQRIQPSGRQKGNQKDCDALQREMEQEEVLLKAFEDQGLLDEANRRGLNGEEYYEAVKNLARNAFDTQQWTDFNDMSSSQQDDMFKSHDLGDRPDYDAPMETTTQCRIIENWDLTRYVQEFGKHIGPKMQGAHRAHEGSHRNTCRRETDWYSPGEAGGGPDMGWPVDPDGYSDYMNDPNNYSNDEIKAYKAGLAEKQKALDAHCK